MAVVGVGGVGSVTAEMLTRCGIGKVSRVSLAGQSGVGLWIAGSGFLVPEHHAVIFSL